MNIRTIHLNDPIQCKILFYICGPDFVAVSTILCVILEENRAALSKHFIPFPDGVQKSDFVT